MGFLLILTKIINLIIILYFNDNEKEEKQYIFKNDKVKK